MSPRKAIIAVLLAAAAARADGDSTTLFDSHPHVRDGGYQESSIYQRFSVTARAEGTDWLQDVQIIARGWGRLTIGPPFDDHHLGGDVDSLFFEGRLLKRHLLLRLGRQLAVGGAMRATQIDGLTAEAVLVHGLGVNAWVGVPVQPRFYVERGDFITGGRIFWRKAFDSEVGASYVYALRGGYLSRNDLALDGSWKPLRALSLSGLAQWSIEEDRLAEAKLRALVQVDPKLQVIGDVGRTSPDLFIDRSSIFAVFAEERRDQVGGEIVYRLLPPLTLDAEYHWLWVTVGHGNDASLLATWQLPRGNGSYGAQVRYLDEPDNGYFLARVYGIRKLPRNLTVTLDLEAYWLQKSLLTNEKQSFIGTLTGGWAITPAWDLMVAGSLGATPAFERRTQVIARLVYKFGLPPGMPGGFK
jgi:hypothetical protein